MATFNYSPGALTGGGSYNTTDWLSALGGLATGGAAGAAAGIGVNDAVARLQALGETGLKDYTGLAGAVTQGIDFKPYALTNALGSTQQTAPGTISQQLTPQQQANVTAAQGLQGSLYGAPTPDTSRMAQGAFSGAQGMLGQVGVGQEDLSALRAGYGSAAQGMLGGLGADTSGMANTLFQQQQAMRDPMQQRQQAELENRLRSQGRLGTTTTAYGGTPEQLAMAKAIQEQQSSDAFTSMTQAEQMAAAQQNRALGLGQATSGMAQTQQALTAGDVANTQGMFNLGSSAAQLPQAMQGQNIAQAGQLQAQALAPSSQQLQQLQAAGTLGQQQSQSAASAGGLFGQLAGAGLQERLTAESAAGALRGKQYASALSSLASQGGQTGTAANTVQQAINSGIQNIGGKLYDAGGKLLGEAAGLLGNAASDLWSSLSNQYPAGNNPDEVGSGLAAEIGEFVSGGADAIKNAWNSIFG